MNRVVGKGAASLHLPRGANDIERSRAAIGGECSAICRSGREGDLRVRKRLQRHCIDTVCDGVGAIASGAGSYFTMFPALNSGT